MLVPKDTQGNPPIRDRPMNPSRKVNQPMQHQSKPRAETSKDVGLGTPVIDNGKFDTYLITGLVTGYLDPMTPRRSGYVRRAPAPVNADFPVRDSKAGCKRKAGSEAITLSKRAKSN